MDWYQAAVFLYAGTVTHFLADLLSHKKKRGKFILLYCFLYTLCFIPLFCWLKVDFLWLLLLFFSHLIIDALATKLSWLVDFMPKAPEKPRGSSLMLITLGIDQALHLLMLIVIALFVF
jgi:hypothetical protein